MIPVNDSSSEFQDTTKWSFDIIVMRGSSCAIGNRKDHNFWLSSLTR
jgi:hypothetical protein